MCDKTLTSMSRDELVDEVKRLRAALTMALEYEPDREDFQSSSKGDLQFAESQKVWAEMRSVLPSPPTQEGGD